MRSMTVIEIIILFNNNSVCASKETECNYLTVAGKVNKKIAAYNLDLQTKMGRLQQQPAYWAINGQALTFNIGWWWSRHKLWFLWMLNGQLNFSFWCDTFYWRCMFSELLYIFMIEAFVLVHYLPFCWSDDSSIDTLYSRHMCRVKDCISLLVFHICYRLSNFI